MPLRRFTFSSQRRNRFVRKVHCVLPKMTNKLCLFILYALLMPGSYSFTSRYSRTTHKGRRSSVFASTTTELAEPSAVVSRVFENDKRPVILFDGVCNLCNGAVNLALDWDPRGALRFSALQSNVGRALLQANGRQADDISSIVLVTEDAAYIKSDAVLEITKALTPPFLPVVPAAALAQVLVPQILRDIIYDGVADNRYQILGKQDQCRLDDDGAFADRFVSEDLAM